MALASHLTSEELTILDSFASCSHRGLSGDVRLGFQNQARVNAQQMNQNQKRAGQHHRSDSKPLTAEQAAVVTQLLGKHASVEELLAAQRRFDLG